MASAQPSSSSSSSPSGDAGPAGLGKMSSLSPECTPLKHKYDSCFNAWFEHYLQVTAPSSPSSPSSASGSSGSSGPESSAAPVRTSLWGRSSHAPQPQQQGQTQGGEWGAPTDPREVERRTKLREELDNKCGLLFGEYQGCVKRALKDRQLLPLLATARELNPFPFPPADGSGSASKASASDDDKNFPFPFSAASPEERAK